MCATSLSLDFSLGVLRMHILALYGNARNASLTGALTIISRPRIGSVPKVATNFITQSACHVLGCRDPGSLW